MAYDYAAERLDAERTLKEDGAAVVLGYTAPGTQNGATGAVTPGVPLTLAAYAILKDYKDWAIDGTTIQRGDLNALCSADGLALAGVRPEAGWTLAVTGGETYRVMAATAVAPGGVAVLWRLQLRK